MIKHKKNSLIADGGDMTLVQPSDWNDDHTVTGGLDLPHENPSVPPTDTVRVFGRKVGGRMMPAFKGPSGLDTALQPSIARNSVQKWVANGIGTNVTSIGLTSTSIGTATQALVAPTNIHTAIRRMDYLVTTAATTAIAASQPTSLIDQLFRGTGVLGGFHVVMRFGGATGMPNASHRFYAGLQNSIGNASDTQPSSRNNLIGVGYDSADANWHLMHRRGTDAVTKIDLGSLFPRQSVDRSKMYELVLFCPPAGTSVTYEFTDLGTGDVALGNITTNLPDATTLMRPLIAASVGGVSTVIGIAVSSIYIETDY